MEERKWTEADVLNILTNPVCAGFGPFPQMVPDATFIEAGTRLIKERGAAWYIETLLAHLRKELPAPPADDPTTQQPAPPTRRPREAQGRR
ncbi:MAG: hypothetical protein ACLQVI_32595 [Polyangiaceae bacterium]